MEKNWSCWMGDFAILRDTLSKRKVSCLWVVIGLIDSILRGIGQVFFANNTISGMLIVIVLCSTYPKNLLAGLSTGLLGLLLSILIEDGLEAVENGLTVYNPFLIGWVTFAMCPDQWSGFFLLLTVISSVFSVYLARSLSSKRVPCVTIPFNIAEILLLTVLAMTGEREAIKAADQLPNPMNISSEDFDVNKINSTNLDWGLFFRGIVTSSSQVLAIDSVPVAAIIYLALLIYSPATTIFSLIGAIIGCFTALGLEIPYESIYSGLWGYNSLLSGASFGGLFLVLNKQTIPLAFVVSIFTILLQYILQPIFERFQLPVLTVPFVLTFWLFIGIREKSRVFPQPQFITFPEEQRFKFLSDAERDENISNNSLEPISVL